jgi:predicted MarR family transcription regulator
MNLSSVINAYGRENTIITVTDLKKFRDERLSLKDNFKIAMIREIKDTYNTQYSSKKNVGTAVVTELTYTKEGRIATVIVRKPILDLVA